jgi:uncharacterized protein YjbI with pentapeptide repeats
MANTWHLNVFNNGLAEWNRWRASNPHRHPDLSGIDLRGQDLRGVNFSSTTLTKADLSAANLDGCTLENADLSQANLTDSTLIRARSSGAKFRRSRLYQANCFQAQLRNADFRGANLNGASFRQCELHESDFSGADMVGVDFSKARLNGAVIRRANVARANFSKVQMIKATFFGCNLDEATLVNSDLSWSSLSRAHLKNADLRGAILRDTNLSGSLLNGANLVGADLSRSRLIDVDLQNASIAECRVFGISAWNVNTEGTDQSNLKITRRHEPRITTDNIEVAQFIYLLLNHKKLREVLDSVTERGVLILGRFGGGGLDVLYSIASKLREFNYLPMIFDFARPEQRNYTETVKTLVGLSRFVIVDLSGPSIPQELTATVPHFKIPFLTIMEKGKTVYSMFSDILEYPWVSPPLEYASVNELMDLIPSEILEVAESRLTERLKLLDRIFG